MSDTTLKLETAQKVINAAIAKAKKLKLKVTVVVADRGGRMVASARMDGAPYITHDIAFKKATTVANFGAPLPVLGDMATGDPLLAMVFQSSAELCVTPGGMPILVDDAPIGGVGVSGASYNEDQAVAEAAVKNL